MLELKNISQKYPRSPVFTVESVSLNFERGKIYSVVGESGSGKSTLGKIVGGMLPPTLGELRYEGKSVYPADYRKRREYLRKVQLILQDGKSALNPKRTIYQSISEPLVNFEKLSGDELSNRVASLLKQTELPENVLKRFPSELSGGQQKRVCIARALATNPTMIIFDEAVSGLDMIVQKKLLTLLTELQHRNEATYLFITHDMGAALLVSDEILVMKDGKLLERVDCNEGHPEFREDYSKRLLRSAFSNH